MKTTDDNHVWGIHAGGPDNQEVKEYEPKNFAGIICGKVSRMQSNNEKAEGAQYAAFQALGTSHNNGMTMLAIFGALATIYYGLKGVHKMFFATSEFQKINEDEIEC